MVKIKVGHFTPSGRRSVPFRSDLTRMPAAPPEPAPARESIAAAGKVFYIANRPGPAHSQPKNSKGSEMSNELKRIVRSKYRAVWVMAAILMAGQITGCVQLASRYQCVSDAEIYRAADDRDISAPALQEGLACPDSGTVRTALTAAGRIGGEQAVSLIRPSLGHSRDAVREQAAFALGISGHASAVPALESLLASESDGAVRARAFLALGNLGGEQALGILQQALASRPGAVEAAGILQGLGTAFAYRRTGKFDATGLDPEVLLDYLGKRESALPAAFALARAPQLPDWLPEARLIAAWQQVSDQQARAYLARALGQYRSEAVVALLDSASRDSAVNVRIEATRALSRFRDLPEAKMLVMAALDDQEPHVQATALQAIGSLGVTEPEQLQRVEEFLTSESPWLRSLALQAMATIDPARGLALARQWLESGDTEPQRVAIGVLGNMAPAESRRILSAYADSNDAILRQAACSVNRQCPEPQSGPKRWPPAAQLEPLPQRVTLRTSRGDIVIALFEDTPYTSRSIVELARSGYYDGSFFSRVIPNFVAQGGDPVGDGSGSVEFTLREELSARSHRPGTVGLATSGKDTGGAQFFINTAPNLHLDNNYTLFGEVISGLDVAMKLQQGDRILGIE